MDKKPTTKKTAAKKAPAKKTIQKKAVKKTATPASKRKAPIKPMEKGRKATKEQHDQIVIEVGKLISDLHTSRYIVDYIGQRWGLQRSQAAKYIAEARKVFRNELPNPAQAQADLLEKLLDAEKEYRGRGMPHLMALKQIRELVSPTRVQIGGDPAGAPIKTEHKQITISPEDIAAAITAVENEKE